MFKKIDIPFSLKISFLVSLVLFMFFSSVRALAFQKALSSVESLSNGNNFILRRVMDHEAGILISWDRHDFDGRFILRRKPLSSQPFEIDKKIYNLLNSLNIASDRKSVV